MLDKLLCIKNDKNIVLYKVLYKKDDLNEYIKYIDKLYSYVEEDIITTNIIDGKIISMGKYDNIPNCKVDKDYKILEELKNNNNKRTCIIKIKVTYCSLFAKALKNIFINDKKLINMTEYIKLVNHIIGIKNDFTFNKILDLQEKKLSWNDPGRIILNEMEYDKYLRLEKEILNIDNIVLNKQEEKYKNELIGYMRENLNKFIKYEQVGMFPIQDYNSKLYEIFDTFAERNKDYEDYICNLDNAPININGSIYIGQISDHIINDYALSDENKINKDLDNYKKVKSSMKF